MSTKHTYTLLFRGQLVQEFTSVHDQQAVRLGYRRYPAQGQSRFDVPTGTIANKPEVLRKMKTLAALKRDPETRSAWTQWSDQTFTILVKPGTTEITDCEVQ